MKNWPFISSTIQLCIGIAAVAAYIVIAVCGELSGRWTVTLLLAIAFVVFGIIGITDWVKKKKRGD